ncbi:MAG: DUF99 family protein [Methanoregulaceae archaeon]
MPVPKKGVRVLGIAESYTGHHTNQVTSTLAGIVMRRDLVIDGIVFGSATVGGMDATNAVLEMIRTLNRDDINLVMMSGCVISWFNILDPIRIFEETGLPVTGVTYEDSEGLEEDILHHFPGDLIRLAAYRQLGARRPVLLHTGYPVFIRSWGVSSNDDEVFCNAFTRDGKIPEPLRVARLCARAVSAFNRTGA